ncbi:MAG: hypothetical protein ACI4VW_02025 [Acutalibacteraceae bacterium]
MSENEYGIRFVSGHSRLGKPSGLNKMFSVFLALLPVIAIYSSGISGFNLADIIIMLFLVASILFGSKRKFKIDGRITTILLFCVYVCTLPLLIGAVESSSPLSDVIIRTIRILFYIISAVFLSRRHLDTEIFKKSVITVSMLAVGYILIQYVFYYAFGRFLVGYLPFLEVYQSGYEGVDYLSRFETQFFRPTSFFLEPAHCSRYLIIGFVLTLFNRRMRKRNYICAVIIALGILFTTSGQGYAMVLIVFVCFVFFNPYKTVSIKNMGRIFAVLVFATAVILILYFSTDIIQNTISRISNDSSMGAFSARMGTFFEVLDEEPLYLIFGHGYGAVPYENAWMSGITYILYGSGVIGLLILFTFFVKSIISRKTANRVLALVFFFLFFTDDAFNSYMTMIYLSAILNYMEDVREKRVIYCYGN